MYLFMKITKSDMKLILLQITTKWRPSKAFCFHQNFCPQKDICLPLSKYASIKLWKFQFKIRDKSDPSWNLQQMIRVTKGFYNQQNFVTFEKSALFLRLLHLNYIKEHVCSKSSDLSEINNKWFESQMFSVATKLLSPRGYLPYPEVDI